jgi:hypothetical protein
MFAHGAGWTETNMTFFSVQFRQSWIHRIYLPISMRFECLPTGQDEPKRIWHFFQFSFVSHGSITSPRYCKACPACAECHLHKPSSEYHQHGSRHVEARCKDCQYPTCANRDCDGYRHPFTAVAVYQRHKINGQWFCRRTTTCTNAAALANAAKKWCWLRP